MWKIKRNSNESQPAWAEEEHRTNTIIKSTRRVVVLCCSISISKGRESRAHTQNSKHSRKGKENLQNIKYKKPSSSAAAAELLLCLVYEYISISIESSLLVVVVVAPSRSLFFLISFSVRIERTSRALRSECISRSPRILYRLTSQCCAAHKQ